MFKAIRAFFNWMLPISCIGCGKDSLPACSACLSRVKVRSRQTCPDCGNFSNQGAYCDFCLNGQALDGLLVAFDYEKQGILARMLHLYKYEGLRAYGQILSELLSGRYVEDFAEFIDIKIDFLTWVPLSQKKFTIRGFNQTEKLAEGLPFPVDKALLLYKCRETCSQMKLNRKERLTNLTGAFRILPQFEQALADKNILIVDDVATTTATLKEMAGVLKAAGANSVYGLVLARQQE